MDCVAVSNSSSGGKASVVIRSLSLNRASFAFCGGESVSMGLRLDDQKSAEFPMIPYFTCRNVRSAEGRQGTSSCHVSTLHRVRRVVERMHCMTRYQCSTKSGRRASSNTQKC